MSAAAGCCRAAIWESMAGCGNGRIPHKHNLVRLSQTALRPGYILPIIDIHHNLVSCFLLAQPACQLLLCLRICVIQSTKIICDKLGI